MKAPGYWVEDGILPRLLQPFSLAYRAGAAIRRSTSRPHELDIPVICVGNLVAGGAGKTPVALSIASRLIGDGTEVTFLSRGHGGTIRGPAKVQPSIHSARDVGDEALLLAETASTWVARHRAKGATAARADGAGLIIMDDGFQNFDLKKTLSLVVIDGAFGFGNKRVHPAGPLREPIETGLARADGLIMIGEDRTNLAPSLPPAHPLLRAKIVPRENHHLPPSTKVLGFAGIGRPTKFRETLEELHLSVIGFEPFPDHHVFTTAEINAILGRAEADAAIPVTTAKDHVRLPKPVQARVQRLDITLAWQDESALAALLNRGLYNGSG
ncbi:MAG: tetraacyldisaccharide 4'-kinase [Alphaproteobacteria bacterium]|nr:tetraacyldisaccharide 4'-kinase [Alphaproteobacteria bacterium]